MPFDWMDTTTTSARTNHGAEGRTQALCDEVRDRAGLFKRLGHPKAHAVHRCLGNIAWAYAAAGKPPVSAAEVRRIVEEIKTHYAERCPGCDRPKHFCELVAGVRSL